MSDHPRLRGDHSGLVFVAVLHLDHPRLRGDHPTPCWCASTPTGSSPPTRGPLGRLDVAPHQQGIIPAYAGTTTPRCSACSARWDHPRLRGDHPRLKPFMMRRPGSSPPTRGPPPGGTPWRTGSGIIPAYAGTTSPRRGRAFSARDHPRLRGDHLNGETVPIDRRGSSPPTRGPLRRRGQDRHAQGIIPAYAGTTTASAELAELRGDHPRLRGDHSDRSPSSALSMGSSPPTRGPRRERVGRLRAGGIIPAYAGTTPWRPS